MEENQQPQEVEIDLRDVFRAIWGHMLTIILSAIVAGLAVLLFTKLFITPRYTSETKVYILNRTDQTTNTVNTNDLNTSPYLTQDYLQIVTARPVMQDVIAELQLDMTPAQLADEITVSNPSDTRYIVIDVEDEDPYMAQSIANAVRISSAKHITEIMDIQAVNTVEEADMPTSKSSPHTMKDAAIGALAGAVIAIIVVILNFMFNDTIRTTEDIERYLKLSVLGVIPLDETAVAGNHKGKKTKKGKA